MALALTDGEEAEKRKQIRDLHLISPHTNELIPYQPTIENIFIKWSCQDLPSLYPNLYGAFQLVKDGNILQYAASLTQALIKQAHTYGLTIQQMLQEYLCNSLNSSEESKKWIMHINQIATVVALSEAGTLIVQREVFEGITIVQQFASAIILFTVWAKQYCICEQIYEATNLTEDSFEDKENIKENMEKLKSLILEMDAEWEQLKYDIKNNHYNKRRFNDFQLKLDNISILLKSTEDLIGTLKININGDIVSLENYKNIKKEHLAVDSLLSSLLILEFAIAPERSAIRLGFQLMKYIAPLYGIFSNGKQIYITEKKLKELREILKYLKELTKQVEEMKYKLAQFRNFIRQHDDEFRDADNNFNIRSQYVQLFANIREIEM